MKYREQLLQEIEQTESQLKKLEKSERSKMRERNRLNQEILKILMKKQEVEKKLKEKQENLRELQRMGLVFKQKIQYPIGLKFSADGGKTFIALGNIVETYIPNTKNIASGSINASKLSVDSLGLKEFEVTLKQDFSKEEFEKFRGILW